MFNFSSDDTANFIYLILLLAFLVNAIIFNKKIKASKVILQLSCWLGIALLIIFLYSFRYEFINAKNRIKSELFPSSAIIQNDQIIINISQDNHYYIDLIINNEKIKFLIDTGASDLVLSKFDAKKIGIDFDRLNFNKIYQTANGQTKGASIILDNIEISGLLFKNIPASVNLSPMRHSLLGMRFLNNFKKYEFYQNRLILTLF
jgi:aspartyl protease family protein